jgi:hypothetical protein
MLRQPSLARASSSLMPSSFAAQATPVNDIMSKAFYLNDNFKNNIIDMLSSNLKLNQSKKKSIEDADKILGNQTKKAKMKWEKLIHFMLNIDDI